MDKLTNEEIIKKLEEGNRLIFSRVTSLLENGDPRGIDILNKIYSRTGNGYIIGVTGPPGSGKSTLVDHMARFFRHEKKTVGIIAIDPTSPFTGGAILGDRIRMQQHAADPGVFIRSMATRKSLGGIAATTSQVIDLFDAFGMEIIIVETVGVGQAEIEITKAADTTIVVLPPGLGDGIQAIKAGILEIADIFVLNKADRQGIDALETEMKLMLEFHKNEWVPPLCKTVATEGKGIPGLMTHLAQFREYMHPKGILEKRRSDRHVFALREFIKSYMMKDLDKQIKENENFKNLFEKVRARELSPYQAANKLYKLLVV